MARPKLTAVITVSGVSGYLATVSTSGTHPGWHRTIKNWSIQWGDGSSIVGTGTPSPTTHSHLYTVVGQYPATLSVTDSANVTITASTVVTIGQAPIPPSVVSVTLTGPTAGTIGQSLSYTASATYSDGSHADVTAASSWSSSAASAATVSSPGVIAAIGAGSTAIAATYTAIVSSPVTLVIAAPPPDPPSTPSTPTPTNGATGITLTPTLQWTSTGATTYTVKFGTSSPPPTVATGVASSSYAPSALANSVPYFWQIVAVNGSGSTTGPIWTFTTVAPPPPPPVPPTTLTITAPTGVSGVSLTGDPVSVTFAATTAGGTAPVVIVYSPASGSLFAVGTTLVTATATDAGSPQQTAQTTFNVTVTQYVQPATCQDPAASNYGQPGACVYLTTDPTIGPDPVEPLSTAQRSSRMKAPGPGMHFTTGLPLRLFADAGDAFGYLYPTDTTIVHFYVDGALVGTLNPFPGEANHWELRLNANLPVGDHVLTMDSVPHAADLGPNAVTYPGAVPVTIHIDAFPVKSGGTVTLTSDLVLSGSTPLNWSNVVVQGNGFKVIAGAGYAGPVTISNAFVTGLANYDQVGVDITTSGNLAITNSIFEATAAMRFVVTGSGTLVVQGNECRENNLLTYSSVNPDATTVLELTASTTATPVFQGNNIGFGIVILNGGTNWDIGGTTPAESNVFMGPRAVLRVENATTPQIAGNYLHHEYKNGASQGFCLRMPGCVNGTVEHNLIREGSWPLQDVAAEVRYNVIIDQGGHDTWRSARPSGASFHHNIVNYVWYAGMPLGGALLFYQGESVGAIHHNTFDMGGSATNYEAPFIALNTSEVVSEVHSNALTGWGATAPFIQTNGGQVLAYDHNGEFRGDTDPQFAHPRDTLYKVQESRIWNRDNLSVFDVLSYYRNKYAPGTGSPLIGTGRSGTNQGAVDAVASQTAGRTAQPRIWLTPAVLSVLQAKAAANDADWLAVKASADTLLTYTVPAFQVSGGPNNAILYDYQGGGWGSAWTILGLAYQVTGTVAYATKAKEVISVAIAPFNDSGILTPISTDSGYPTRAAAAGLALAYDWCYDQLDATMKTGIFTTMHAWYDWYKAHALTATGPAFSNYFGGHLFGFGLYGVASAGDDPRGTEIRDYMRTLFGNTVGASFNTGIFQGGYPCEGATYGINHFVRLLNYMQAVKTGTGEDLITGSGYGQKILKSLFYNFKPNRWQYTDTADNSGDTTGIPDAGLFVMLPTLLGNTTDAQWAQWFYQHLATAPTAGGTEAINKFLWANPALPSADYRSVQPLVYNSAGDGHVYTRTDWTDTAVWSSFKAGAAFAGNESNTISHATREAGHLAIQRGTDYLLVNSGQWKGATGYSGNPQAFDNRSWRTNTLVYQNPYSADYLGAQGYWGVDAILAYQTATAYTYCKTDLTTAYTNNIPTGLVAYVRSFFAFPDGTFVVYSRVQAPNTTDLKTLYWHFNPNGMPSVSGTLVTSTVGASKLYMRTVLPATPTLTVVADPVSDTDPTTITYRVEVVDSVSSVHLRVLSVFKATDLVTAMPATTVLTPSGMSGVEYASKVVLVSTDGTTRSSVTYTTSASAQHLLTDLTPYPKLFTVLQNGTSIGSFAASDQGVVTFAATGGGTFQVS